jgi:hydroxymethylbilane synthase
MGLVLGSRGSELALWQCQYVARLLQSMHGPSLEIEIRVFSTKGDRVQDKPLPEIGGKGLFTEELEGALSRGDIDLAVHSLKDLPTVLPVGLGVVAVPRRADPRDAMVLRPDHCESLGEEVRADPRLGLELLPEGAVVGTSSVRRVAQLHRMRPDVVCKDIRGNVPTRLRKMDEGQYDALILACAGLDRLGLGDRITRRLDGVWVGAPGQGAIGIEGRGTDERVLELVRPLEHRPTRIEVDAERTVLAALEGGCSMPLAAAAKVSRTTLRLEVVVLAPDGSQAVRVERRGEATLQGARRLGRIVARQLLERGAGALLGRE